MFGFRYHVVTLCALFIMLGIGIVIGSVSGLGPALSKQQSSTIQSLSKKLDNVLAESEQDHSLLQRHEDALAALVPQLIQGKLAGRRIALVRTGDYGDAVNAASEAIEAAGGTVTSATTFTNRLVLLDETQRQKIAADLKMSASGDADNELASVLHPLAAAFHVGTANRPDLQDDLNTLQDDGVIDMSGDYSTGVTDVVVVGGSTADSDADGDNVEAALVGELTAYGTGSSGMVVVGCEPYDAGSSSMPTFAQAGIASVDCIDLPIGGLDLPFALASGDVIAYGVKSTATRLVPADLASASDQIQSPPNPDTSTKR
jgi:hypothetical protein